ncbi:DUF2937 family protein [Salipiger sp. 1_MG-2023]|uniref:DUF2937 family protein n=1 Tax=Salipiger sp. 1_MG-2023 TaxID=3062665 RepID=UPI0026E2BFD0|nr:DUF2937 family protein [Salipiger sp. 1_MG-2023]MDO6586495.1 DUF2937 family protein [Salipiger sp. 1_MG-2023]
MITRAFAMIAGMTGAVGLSQFPEYSQQYTQRLGGAVDELSAVVAQFDHDAAGVGLDRGEALRQLATAGEFGAARAESMRQTIARQQRLAGDLAALDGAGPFMRARLAGHLGDPDIAARAWQAFRPALPVSFEGVTYAAAGFGAGWLALALVAGLARRMLRRRPRVVRG